jgi:hypothetical protein
VSKDYAAAKEGLKAFFKPALKLLNAVVLAFIVVCN